MPSQDDHDKTALDQDGNPPGQGSLFGSAPIEKPAKPTSARGASRGNDRNLLSHLGFADPDKGNIRHDLGCRYIIESAAAVARRTVEPSDWSISSVETHQEMILKNTRGYTIGFLDVLIWSFWIRRSAHCDRHTAKCTKATIVEVKIAKIPIGDVLRQFALYTDNFKYERFDPEWIYHKHHCGYHEREIPCETPPSATLQPSTEIDETGLTEFARYLQQARADGSLSRSASEREQHDAFEHHKEYKTHRERERAREAERRAEENRPYERLEPLVVPQRYVLVTDYALTTYEADALRDAKILPLRLGEQFDEWIKRSGNADIETI